MNNRENHRLEIVGTQRESVSPPLLHGVKRWVTHPFSKKKARTRKKETRVLDNTMILPSTNFLQLPPSCMIYCCRLINHTTFSLFAGTISGEIIDKINYIHRYYITEIKLHTQNSPNYSLCSQEEDWYGDWW